MFFILHSFVNLFAGGRSTSKAILFALFVVALFVTLLIPSRKNNTRLSWKWFYIPLGAIFLLGLLLHIWYIQTLGLPHDAFVITFSGDALSSSTISHIHLAKVFIGKLLQLLHLSVVNTDAGIAYIDFVPPSIAVLGGVLLVWVLFQSVYQFAISVRPLLSGYTRRQIVAHTLLYAVAIFSLVKSSIDGGLFVPSVAIAVCVIVCYGARLKHSLSTRWYPTILAIVLTFFGVGLFFTMHTTGAGNRYIGIAALVSLYLMLFILSERNLDRRMGTAVAILFLAAWWTVSASDRDLVSYVHTPISQGEAYYRYDKIQKQVVLERAGTNTTLATLTKGVNPTYHPVQVPWKTCLPEAVPLVIRGTLITADLVKAQVVDEVGYRIEIQESVQMNGVWHTDVIVVLDACFTTDD